MFDSQLAQFADRESVVERELRAMLGSVQRYGRLFVYDGPFRTPRTRPRRDGAPIPDDAILAAATDKNAETEEPAAAPDPVDQRNGFEPTDNPAPEPTDDEVAPSSAALALDSLLAAGAEHLKRAQAAQAALARDAAEQARALATFARMRPSCLDRTDEEVGAAAAETRAARPAVLRNVSEWAVNEVSVALRISRAHADGILAESLILVEQLPATLGALECAAISWAHAGVLLDLLAPLSPETRAAVEERVLDRMANKTPGQLRVATRRAIARIDADALAERMVEAIRDRQVRVFPGDDGMATLHATLPAPVARACQDALHQLAVLAATEDDDRTLSQRMSDCLVDLILRHGNSDLPSVQAQLIVTASADTLMGGPEPGEVNGDLVPAPMLRELAYALGLMPRPAADPQPASASAQEPAPAPTPAPESAPTPLRQPEPQLEPEPQSAPVVPPEPATTGGTTRGGANMPQRALPAPTGSGGRARPPTRNRRVRAERRTRSLRPTARSALPLPRLPRPADPLRPRSHGPLPARPDQPRQPALPVPPPPPAVPPGHRLEAAQHRRWRAGMDHAGRGDRHHLPAVLRRRRRPRARTPGRAVSIGRECSSSRRRCHVAR